MSVSALFDPTGEDLRRDLAAWPNRLRPLAALPELRSIDVGKANHRIADFDRITIDDVR